MVNCLKKKNQCKYWPQVRPKARKGQKIKNLLLAQVSSSKTCDSNQNQELELEQDYLVINKTGGPEHHCSNLRSATTELCELGKFIE